MPSLVSISPHSSVGGVSVVPVAEVDQGPGPTALTALTWTSYWVPSSSLVMVYSRLPEVQARATTVQLASDLSGASLRMWRRS